MPRAYLRLDPAFDERKESYPDGPYAALVATFCLAELQAERGRFRSLDYLTRLLGKRGRHAHFLVAHGDLIVSDDGRVYVDGWDEWQEGDWKVAERVARIRGRDKRAVTTRRENVTDHVTVPVTPPVTVKVTGMDTVGDTLDRLSVSGALAVSGSISGAEQSAPDPWNDPERDAVVWLSKHGCDIRPGNGYHRKLVTAVEVHGVNALVGMFDRLAEAGTKAGDVKGFLFGAIDALDARTRPNLADVAKAERADDTEAAHQRRLAATQRHLAELRGTGQ